MSQEQNAEAIYGGNMASRKREHPMFTCKAHVFHIDPMTKRSWVPASSSAVSVSFFYDTNRGLYRIISVDGTKAVINSTVAPGMNFTKTSQKFGQWSDIRANTVYGLGFSSESELNIFYEKFQEVKEAASRNASGSVSTKNTGSSGGQLNCVTIPPPHGIGSPLLQRSHILQGLQTQNAILSQAAAAAAMNNGAPVGGDNDPSNDAENIPMMSDANANSLMSKLGSPLLQKNVLNGPRGGNLDSPKHSSTLGRPQDKSPEAQLKYENERLRLALAQSSVNAKKWDVELSTLKQNNVRLTAALQESTANVDEWKRQLQAYKDENVRLKQKCLEVEGVGPKQGNTELSTLTSSNDIRREIDILKNQAEDYKNQLKNKEDEIKILRDCSSYDPEFNNNINNNNNNNNESFEESQRKILESLNNQLSEKIAQLLEIHQEFSNILKT